MSTVKIIERTQMEDPFEMRSGYVLDLANRKFEGILGESAGKPATWKLPYLKADGTVDDKRLPKAIQCLLSNFRGTKVKNIPESDVSQVLLRLARCAKSAELLPPESIRPAPVYQQLVMVLEQNNLLSQLQAPTASF